MDEIDISEINERSKCIWVEENYWKNLEASFNKAENYGTQQLITIKKGENKNAICLKVFKKRCQNFFSSCLGNGKEIIRAGMDIECFKKLSELNPIACDLYGQEETLELLKNNKDGVIIVVITRPKNFHKIQRRTLRDRKKRSKNKSK